MSGEADQDYLADGIVESITAALSRVRSFFVIARALSVRLQGTDDERAARSAAAGRRLRAGRQRAEGRRAHPHQRAADRDRRRRERLDRASRRDAGRHLRPAGPHHRAGGRRAAALDPHRRDRALTAQAAAGPGRLRLCDARHAARLGAGGGGERQGAGAVRQGAGDRSGLPAGALARRLVPRPAAGLHLGDRHRGRARRWR